MWIDRHSRSHHSALLSPNRKMTSVTQPVPGPWNLFDSLANMMVPLPPFKHLLSPPTHQHPGSGHQWVSVIPCLRTFRQQHVQKLIHKVVEGTFVNRAVPKNRAFSRNSQAPVWKGARKASKRFITVWLLSLWNGSKDTKDMCASALCPHCTL